MSSVTQTAATLDDLRRVDGTAELILGRIVHLTPTGYKPNRVAGVIYRGLDDHAQATGVGVAFTDNMGFTVPELSSGRQSFSPDASYYIGPPRRMIWTSSAGRQPSLSRCVVKVITGPLPKRKWLPKGPITSRPARRWSGTSIPRPSSSSAIEPSRLIAQRCSPLDKPPMPSLPSPVGDSPSTGSLLERADWLGSQDRRQ
jgi:hypothetical protein